MAPTSPPFPRSLKRTKAYESLNDLQPTIRNKPSGLVNYWPRVMSDTGPATARQPSTSMLPAISPPTAELTVASPQLTSHPTIPTLDSLYPSPSMLDATTPCFTQPSLPFPLDTCNHALQQMLAQAYSGPVRFIHLHGHLLIYLLCSLARFHGNTRRAERFTGLG